jgi:UDP-N-acetyl-D-glucosamine dehydrogenase
VGLPIAILIAEHGHKVVGIDLNKQRVEALNSGQSPIEDISGSDLVNVLEKNLYYASNDFNNVSECQIIIICVPTPLTSEKLPDLSYLEKAILSITPYLKKDSLIVIESTISPGTTRNYIGPLIENSTKMRGEDYLLSFSPERIDPRNSLWTLKNTPKLVSGINTKSCQAAKDFYSEFIEEIVVCESLEIAETAKLLENSFRLINISFINEIAMFCQKFGIDVNEVIRAAETKPYGFMSFYPSIGIGGHCIPVDPIYLSKTANDVGSPTKMIDLAVNINNEMPLYFLGRAEEIIGNLKSKRILLIGVSYKPNVADVRETPVEKLMLGLREKGSKVFWHDDFVKEWNGEKSVPITSDYDLAIIAAPHDNLDLNNLGSVPVLNTRSSI